jgi:putative transposase
LAQQSDVHPNQITEWNRQLAGARMLVRMVRREGFVAGRKHVSTSMKRMGVEAPYRKPNTSRKHAAHKI